MKYFLIVLTMVLSLSFSYSALAQSAEDSVKTVINNLFTGMKTADPVLLRSCFSDSAIMQTIGRNKEGKTIVRNDGVQGFIDFVGKEKPGAAEERIIFETIKIDGPLAIVWTPYNFYYNGQFSHCGVNSFQLVKFNGVWKIQYLIDTRRKQGCTP
jgi:hypothetical protein